MTSPEKSNASGPVPPHRYGLPRWACAKLIAVATAALGVIRESSVPVPMHAAEVAPDAEFALVALTVTPPLAYVEAQPSTAVTYESRWLYAKIALWTLVCTPCAIRYFAAPAIASAGL